MSLNSIDDKHCIVFGSAPEDENDIPVALLCEEDLDYCIIGANGGAAIARDMGFDVDILATTSHLFRENATPMERKTVKMIRGMYVEHVFVDEKNGALDLDLFPVSSVYMHHINEGQRESLVEEVTGKKLWVSTGLWALCLAG